MRKLMIIILPLSATIVASCGPQKLELPNDPIDRAATCAVVSAAAARAGAPTVAGGLGFDQQTRIIHYAMLAGTDDQGLSTKRTAAVVVRMNDLQSKITEGEWQKLTAPCDSAYPEVKKTSGIELPASKFDAELGCYVLGDFLTRAVQSPDAKGAERLAIYSKMHRDLDGPIGAGLKARGVSKVAKTQSLKDAALGRMTRLGPPAQVMKMCTDRFA